MAVVGFSFSKIFVEKKEKIPDKTKVNSKINVTKVTKEDIKLIQGKDTIKFDFEFTLDYSPNLAKLEFGGHILLVEDPKEADKIVADWKKGQKLDNDLKFKLYNLIFNKCNVKAFELEEDFNLPLHLKLPQLKKE